VERLTKIYRSRRKEVRAVDNISFDISKNEIVGILGPNGAGKTTTIKSILGLLIPDEGEIFISGRKVGTFDRWIYRNIAAVLEGNRNVYWRLTVRENLEFFAGLQGYKPSELKEKIDFLLQRFGLESRQNDQVRTLSRGMQQKVAVAVAFIRNTPILFLDEPTLGLDVESSLELRKTLRELASENLKTVLISSHDMKVVEEICERVIILKNGRIIANDRIPNLKSLFRTIAYKIVYEGMLQEELKTRLKDNFLNVTFGKMNFVVELKRTEDIYDLMDLLRSYKIQIKSLKAEEPDFERVYIELIKGGEVN